MAVVVASQESHLQKECLCEQRILSSILPRIFAANHEIHPSAAAADVDVNINVGPDPWNKTYYPKAAHADNSKKPWYIIDAKGQTLGRLASLAANKIRFAHFRMTLTSSSYSRKGKYPTCI